MSEEPINFSSQEMLHGDKFTHFILKNKKITRKKLLGVYNCWLPFNVPVMVTYILFYATSCLSTPNNPCNISWEEKLHGETVKGSV